MGGAVSSIQQAASNPFKAVENVVANPLPAFVGSLGGGMVAGPAGTALGAIAGGGIAAQQKTGSGAMQGSWGSGDPFAHPGTPTFESQIDPETGLLKKQYQQTTKYNEGGLEALRSEALRDPSKMSRWREIQQGQQLDQLGKTQGAQLAQAQSGLAAAGGLSQGARERLQQQNMQQGLMGQQNIWSQMAAADEQKRQAALAGLPGQELAAAQFKSADIHNALDEINKKRAFDLARYQEQMRAWAAGQTAAGMQEPQDKGLFGNMFEGIF
jgi:hypothetical protein